jgi:hypothetical protein
VSRRALVLLLAAPLSVALAGPVAAAPPTSSGTRTFDTAGLSWTSTDPGTSDPQPGNWHIGFLDARRSGGLQEVFAVVEDLQCPAGVTPFDETEEEQPLCEPVGTRVLLDGGEARLRVDARAGTARLSGRLLELALSEEGEPPFDEETGELLTEGARRVLVDVRWTRAGSAYRYERSERYEDDTLSYSSRERGRGFPATVSGRIDSLGLQDVVEQTASVERFSSRMTGEFGEPLEPLPL